MTAQQFLESRLSASGLTTADAKALGIKAHEKPPKELDKAGPGFLIPYYDVHGKLLPTFRYRRDLEQLTGFEALKGDAPKYLQPPATPAEVYLPRIAKIKWADELKSAERSIVITEGELKAAAACKAGFLCIGLGGVWSWRSKRNEQPLIPSLKAIEWKDRDVFIVYDSDAVANHQVAIAENELVKALRIQGAEVRIVRLPTLAGAYKTGLDDFLLAEGKDALTELFDNSPVDELCQEIDKLNEEVTFVQSVCEVWRHEQASFIPFNKFISLAYANRIVSVPTAKGFKEVSVADEWRKSKRRAEVQDIIFKPGEGAVVHTTVHSNRTNADMRLTALNTWTGWGYVPKKGDVSLFSKLLDYICQGEEPAARKWLEQWFAYPVQYPGAKLYSAVVVWSAEQGTGKTLLGDVVGSVYGKHYTAVTHSMLEKSFNGWADRKQFIQGAEITGNDSRRFADQLKDMVTRTTMHVERKYIDSYEIADTANYYFTSNHPDAFFLEDKDRRFFVIDASFPPLAKSFYDAIDKLFIKGTDGRAFLHHHLAHVDLTGFSPTSAAHLTRAKENMKEQSMSQVARWVKLFRTDRSQALTKIYGTGPLAEASTYTIEEVFKAYRAANDDDQRTKPAAISRALAAQGVKKLANGLQVVTKAQGRQYVWGDPDKTPGIEKLNGAKVGELFDKERGKVTKAKERKF